MQCHSTFDDDDRAVALLEALGLAAEADDVQLFAANAVDLATGRRDQPREAVHHRRGGPQTGVDTDILSTPRYHATRGPQAYRRREATADRRRRRRNQKGKDRRAAPQALSHLDRGRPRHGRGTRGRPQRIGGAAHRGRPRQRAADRTRTASCSPTTRHLCWSHE
jgi:hypothetical protein